MKPISDGKISREFKGREQSKMYICIDFDGTIVDHSYPDIGAAAPGAISWLRNLQDNYGVLLILFTMRCDSRKHGRLLQEAVDYLEKNRVFLYGVNRNPDQKSWTSSPKAYGHIYVDDAAIGCPLIRPPGFQRPCVDWQKVGPMLESILQRQL